MPPEPARILYVQPNSEVGGSDLALLRMVESLDLARFAPTVLLPHDGPLAPRLEAAGAAVRLLPMMQLRTLPSPTYQGRYLTRFWPTVIRLAGVIRSERIDLVHTNSLYSLYGGWAARFAGRPHVWHIREIPPSIPIARPALGRMVLALSRRVVAMTRACTEGLFGAATPDKLRVLTDGLDLATWAPRAPPRRIRQELGIAEETPVVGFVARLDPWKGLHVFLDAAALIARRFPDAVFLVAGDAPDGFEDYRDRMQAQARTLGIEDRVRFLGWRYRLDDIPDLMAALDVFSHTSVEPEPFGLVVIEAMAMRCPVVAAAGGGPLEIIEDGRSGLLTPMGDAAAHADAVAGLLADPAHRRVIAEGGRTRVERQYSKARFQQDLARLYDDVLAGERT